MFSEHIILKPTGYFYRHLQSCLMKVYVIWKCCVVSCLICAYMYTCMSVCLLVHSLKAMLWNFTNIPYIVERCHTINIDLVNKIFARINHIQVCRNLRWSSKSLAFSRRCTTFEMCSRDLKMSKNCTYFIAASNENEFSLMNGRFLYRSDHFCWSTSTFQFDLNWSFI